jgi:hypothetical protein
MKKQYFKRLNHFVTIALLITSIESVASIKGKVVDEKSGAGITGVSVSIKGTPVQTTTNNQGEFEIASTLVYPSEIKNIHHDNIRFNPLTNAIEWSWNDNISISIFNLSGKLVASNSTFSPVKQRYFIPEYLPNSEYMVQISSPHGTHHAKLMKSSPMSGMVFFSKNESTANSLLSVAKATAKVTLIFSRFGYSGKEVDVENPSENNIVKLAAGKAKLRVIMSTDFPPTDVKKDGGGPADHKSDPDDMQSMVRFLLYANEFDIEALIASSGTFANVAKKQNILDVLDLYEKVYDNLKNHSSDYPTAAYLKSVTFQGLSGTWGKSGSTNVGAGKDSEASTALIEIIDKPDPRPVYIGIWGDCSVIAQAVWKVKNTRSAEELDAFVSKLRIHQIATQDGTIDWLKSNFPKMIIIHSAKTYQGMFGGSDPNSNLAWVNTNIRNGHGPLCAVYPPEGMGCTGVCEGDSPSFLWLVSANRGVNNPDDGTQPSWGGQFKKDGTTNHYLDGPGGSTVSKWRSDYQKEFQERADWCIK